MIEVELPDGEVVDFPDDTDEPTMKRALKSFWDTTKATAETATTIATGAVGEVAGGVAGLATGVVTQDHQAAEAVRAGVSDTLTYKGGEGSQEQLQAVGDWMQPFADVVTRAEDTLGGKGVEVATHVADILELEGDTRDQFIAMGGTVGATTPTAIMELFALKGFKMPPQKSSQLNTFIGAMEKSPERASRAMDMASQNIDRDTIWKETGMWLAPDGNWKAEISDESIRINEVYRRAGQQHGWEHRVSQVIDHPYFKILDDDPDVDLPRVIADAKMKDEELGVYDPDANTIRININKHPTDQLETMLHELQHWIQEGSDFGKGTSEMTIHHLRMFDKEFNTQVAQAAVAKLLARAERRNAAHANMGIAPKDPHAIVDEWAEGYRNLVDEDGNPAPKDLIKETRNQIIFDMYQMTVGEVEARLVEERMLLTEAERAAIPPWQTLKEMGIDEDKIINEDWDKLKAKARNKVPTGAEQYIDNVNGRASTLNTLVSDFDGVGANATPQQPSRGTIPSTPPRPATTVAASELKSMGVDVTKPEVTQTMKVEDAFNLREYDRVDTGEYVGNMSKGEYATFKKDIQENGIKTPIVLEVTPDGRGGYSTVVGEGNHRLQVAKELGIEDIPVQVFMRKGRGE